MSRSDGNATIKNIKIELYGNIEDYEKVDLAMLIYDN